LTLPKNSTRWPMLARPILDVGTKVTRLDRHSFCAIIVTYVTLGRLRLANAAVRAGRLAVATPARTRISSVFFLKQERPAGEGALRWTSRVCRVLRRDCGTLSKVQPQNI
jgi:hypothetical protein